MIRRRAQKVLLGDLLPGGIKPLLPEPEIWMKEVKGMVFPWLSGVRGEILSTHQEDHARKHEVYIMEVMKKAAEIADEMLSTMGWLLHRVSNTSKLYDISDAKGLTAEVSVPIEGGKPGEVVVLLGHSLRNFQARAINDAGSFPKGARVLVVDSGPNILYVRLHGEPQA